MPPPAVSASAASIDESTRSGSRSRRPITRSRTPCSTQFRTSPRRYVSNRPINAFTSRLGRRQLSEENAYSVNVPIPFDGAASTIRRATRAPARWPHARDRPRDRAHLPLPSMMIATCSPPATTCKVLWLIKSTSKKNGGAHRSRAARISASMWFRYRSRALRPDAVRRYSVRG